MRMIWSLGALDFESADMILNIFSVVQSTALIFSSFPSPGSRLHPCWRMLHLPLPLILFPLPFLVAHRFLASRFLSGLPFARGKEGVPLFFHLPVCSREAMQNMVMYMYCTRIQFGPKWLVHDSPEHQPARQERINQQLTSLPVSHVNLSTQSKDTSICHYPKNQTTTSGRNPA